jgi:hypothetical protein
LWQSVLLVEETRGPRENHQSAASHWQLYMATVSNHVTRYLKFSITVNYQWDDDEVHFVLDQHAEFDFYSASSLEQQSTDRHGTPLGHIILISSQPVFALSPYSYVLSGEAINTNFMVFGLTWSGFKPMIYTDAYPWQKLTWPMARWAKKSRVGRSGLIFFYYWQNRK